MTAARHIPADMALIAGGWALSAVLGQAVINTLPSTGALAWVGLAHVASWTLGGLGTAWGLYGGAQARFRDVLMVGLLWAFAGALSAGPGTEHLLIKNPLIRAEPVMLGPVPLYLVPVIGGALLAFLIRRRDPEVGWSILFQMLLVWMIAGGAAGWAGVGPLAGRALSIAILRGLLFGGLVGAGLLITLGGAVPRIDGSTLPFASRAEFEDFLETNPIIRRITRRSRRATLSTRIGIMAGGGALLVMVVLSLISGGGSFNVWSTTCSLALILLPLLAIFLPPMVIAAGAASLTAAEDEQLELLRLTHLSEREMTWAFALASLRTNARLLRLQGTLMALGLGAVLCLYIALLPLWVQDLSITGLILGVFAASIALFGMNLMAAAVGVWVALALRRDYASSVAAPLVVLVLMLTIFGGLLFGLGEMAGVSRLGTGAMLVLLAALPYLIADDLLGRPVA